MRAAIILVLALFACACSSFQPVPVTAGDICAGCQKQISEVKFAAEAITPQGSVLKFRTPECLATYVRQHPSEIAAKFVTDYHTGRMIRPESATYVRTVLDENTREMTHAAFARVAEAATFGKDKVSSPVDWLMIQQLTASDKKGN
jgi:hypothetical protein